MTPLPPPTQSSDRYINTPEELHRRVAELAVSAIALAIAAFGLRLVVALWVPPLAWKMPDSA
ncbi:MAG TPA: hypothetical protein VFT95_03705, partial [Micromonosporaceae bacterium]|nr:hypothetical protein [Micromonosporaceae bacterium]